MVIYAVLEITLKKADATSYVVLKIVTKTIRNSLTRPSQTYKNYVNSFWIYSVFLICDSCFFEQCFTCKFQCMALQKVSTVSISKAFCSSTGPSSLLQRLCIGFQSKTRWYSNSLSREVDYWKILHTFLFCNPNTNFLCVD